MRFATPITLSQAEGPTMKKAWESGLCLGILFALVPGHEEKWEQCAKCGMAKERKALSY